MRLRRPLFTVGMTYGGCLFLAAAVGFHTALIAAAVAALLFLAALAVERFRHHEVILAALLTAVAAFCVFAGREYLTVRPLQRLDGETRTLTLWLEQEQGGTGRATAYYARVQEGDLPKGTRILLWVRQGEGVPTLYEEFTGEVTLRSSDRYRDDGAYLTAATAGDGAISGSRRPWYASWEERRQSFLSGVEEYAAGEGGALIRAICFGDKSRLSDETKEDLAAVGLSHLTAVSGFHMTVIAMGFFGLLIRLGLKRRWAALCAWPIPLLFAALTGFSYSALRAGIMCLILMAAALFRRRADGKNSLGGAVLLILLANPAAVYDLGFLLSVTAALGVLLAMGSIRRQTGVWGGLRGMLTVTAAALAATLPLIAFYFGRLPLLSPLTNLAGEPLAAVTVVAGCLGTLLAGIPPLVFLAKPLFLAAGAAARLLLWIKDLTASMGAVLTVDRPYLLVWACALPLLLAAGYALRGRRGLRIAALMLAAALLGGRLTDMWGMRGVTCITACEAKEGSMLLFSREGANVLVLTGAPRAEEVERFLKRQSAGEPDLLLCTGEIPEGVSAGAILQEGTAAFWNDCTAETAGEWTYVTLGDTGVLICPYGGDLEELPEFRRQAAITIFDRLPPRHAAALSTLQGVVCCGEEELAQNSGAVPWGRYPLEVTAGETVRVYTRGIGDCSVI